MPSTKLFLIYEANNNNYIFKPFFCYSEFFLGYYIKKCFDNNVTLYKFEIDKSLCECFSINHSDKEGQMLKIMLIIA